MPPMVAPTAMLRQRRPNMAAPEPESQTPAMMPMLHGVMLSEVQLLTPKGAFLRLNDGGRTRYMDALLKKRAGMPELHVGEQLYVKVVRIEQGLVVADARTIDQKTGQDTDPFNEQAEVEDWIDVPSSLVGHIIGKSGGRIRALCEESGADMRFDEVLVMPSVSAGRAAHGGVEAARRRQGGGAGQDLWRFLEAARADGAACADDQDENADETADDLRRFLDEARTDETGSTGPQVSKPAAKVSSGGQDAGDDLKRFLADMRDGDEGDNFADKNADCLVKEEDEALVVEFDAEDHANWEKLMITKMQAAGVNWLCPENLTVVDRRGRNLDITDGFSKKHFPIHVRYVVPADGVRQPNAEIAEVKVEAKEEQREKVGKEKKAKKKKQRSEVDSKVQAQSQPNVEEKQPITAQTDVELTRPTAASMADAYLRREGLADAEATERCNAIFISGATNLTKKHISELLEAKDLPDLVALEHVSKDDVVCVFASAEEASEALQGMQEGFEHVEVQEQEGPGLWRVRHGHLTFRMATTADVKPVKTPAKDAVEVDTTIMRLRINGDAIEVAKARAGVMALLEEFLGRAPMGDGELIPTTKPLGPRLLPGEVRELVELPVELVGRVIGKGGETIKKLETQSGARLRVLAAADGLVKGDVQEMSMQGLPAVVEAAKVLLGEILGSAPRQVRRGRCERSVSPSEQKVGTFAVPPKQRPAETTSRPRKHADEALHPTETAAVARKAIRTPDRSKTGGRSSSSSSASPRKLRQRVKKERLAMERREIELYLKRQRQLDEAADAAEAAAVGLLAIASKVPEADESSVAALCGPLLTAGGYSDKLVKGVSNEEWRDVSEACLHLKEQALTPYGAGRVEGKQISPAGTSYLTVRLLSGGSVQALETVVMSWLDAVRQWLGACVLRPTPASTAPLAAAPPKSASWVHQWEYTKARLVASGCGFIVAGISEESLRLFYRLMPMNSDPIATWRFANAAGSCARMVEASELHKWPRSESVLYLVEMCTTPKTVGHVKPYRHDYSTTQGCFSKGDLVVLEGVQRHSRDVGVVRKVIRGAKAERIAEGSSAIPAPAVEQSSSAAGNTCADEQLLRLKRVIRKCTDEERARREGAMVSLEAAALPLLAARLPAGAEALGVGASLSGELLRVFVRLCGDVGKLATASVRASAACAATAAAALGALLGCETELFVSSGPSSKACSEDGGNTISKPVVKEESEEPELTVTDAKEATVTTSAKPLDFDRARASIEKQRKRPKKTTDIDQTKKAKKAAKESKKHKPKKKKKKAKASSTSSSSSTSS
eukprot:TRINITY_DN30187_c0_g1_i1.p1 TRINITY_DN30187_c0_g1~~TRINITY_DN30187_c0_g1_i1.p1  ORF type:complete len:1299 (-),score=320.86 TRINITY_DN30187_c0_g1_i1:294-4190(-)